MASTEHIPPILGEITVELPARLGAARYARLVASSVVSEHGATLDEVEETRVAVDELCTVTVAGAATGAQLRLGFHFVDGVFAVVGTCRGEGSPALDQFAERVLEGLVDHFVLTGEDGNRTFRMDKRIG